MDEKAMDRYLRLRGFKGEPMSEKEYPMLDETHPNYPAYAREAEVMKQETVATIHEFWSKAEDARKQKQFKLSSEIERQRHQYLRDLQNRIKDLQRKHFPDLFEKNL